MDIVNGGYVQNRMGKEGREKGEGYEPIPHSLNLCSLGKRGGRKKEFWQPRIHAWLIKLARNKQNGGSSDNAKRMKPININRLQ